MRNVMRHVSRGKKRRSLDPLATNSTTASDLPALCKNGRNCLALGTSYRKSHTIKFVSFQRCIFRQMSLLLKTSPKTVPAFIEQQ